MHLLGSEPEIWRRLHVPSEISFYDLHMVLQDAFQWDNAHMHSFEIWADGRFRSPIHLAAEEGFDMGMNIIEGKLATNQPLDEAEQQIVDAKAKLAEHGITLNSDFLREVADNPFMALGLGFDMADDRGAVDDMSLDMVAKVGDTLCYTYDMGDNWEHIILCEGLIIAPPRARLPSCIDGGGNHAFEDIGGIDGYIHALQVLKNPKTEEDEEMVEWLEDGYGKSVRKHDPAAFDIKKIKFRHAKK